jgi:hypothetical protein
MSMSNQERRDKVIYTTPFIFWIFVWLYTESLSKYLVDLPFLNNKNKVPRMFFEKSCIEFDCCISNKDIWGFWYQCSIDGNVYWRFSFYGKKQIWGKYGCRFPTNSLTSWGITNHIVGKLCGSNKMLPHFSLSIFFFSRKNTRRII